MWRCSTTYVHIWTIEYNVIMNNVNISHLVVNVVIQYEILILTSYIIDILLFTLVVFIKSDYHIDFLVNKN
jgi:hypothetical protein